MSSYRVLVVDDNPTNLRFTEFALERDGFDVRTARDAAEALDILGAFRPAVILMDLQLPGVSGYELTKQLREQPAHAGIRIVACTAFAMKGDEQRALSAGCDGYLTKPVAPDELRRVVREHAEAADKELS